MKDHSVSESQALTVRESTPLFLESFKDGLITIVDRLSRSFSEQWPIVTFLGSALGVLALYVYVRTIGRTDIFMASVSVQASLFVWLFLVVFVSFAYMFVLIATPSLFSLAISMFGKRDVDKRTAALCLLAPVIAGFVIFAIGIFYFPDYNILWTMLCIVLVTALILIAGFQFKYLRDAGLFALGNKKSFNKNKIESVVFVAVVWLLVMFTVVSGASPALLILRAYSGDLETETVNVVAGIVTLTMIASLLPIVVFYLFGGKLRTRVFYSVLSSIAVFLFVITISSGTLGMITYSAAGILGVRQSESAIYIVGDAYKGMAFDEVTWSANTFGDGRVYITAFPLYSFGDVLLLCPDSLINTNFKDWPKRSGQCFATRNSDMRLAVPKPVSKKHVIGAPAWFRYIQPLSLKAAGKSSAGGCVIPLRCALPADQ